MKKFTLLHCLTKLLMLNSFSYYGLLVFFSHVTLWPGPSVYCSVEDKDRLAFGSAVLNIFFNLWPIVAMRLIMQRKSIGIRHASHALKNLLGLFFDLLFWSFKRSFLLNIIGLKNWWIMAGYNLWRGIFAGKWCLFNKWGFLECNFLASFS